MIINLTHQKGGVGKSTLATNIAVALNGMIIDLDSQKSSIFWNKIRTSNNLEPLICVSVDDEKELKQVIKENADKNIIIDSGGYNSFLTQMAILNCDILLTPVAPSQVELFGLQNFIKILQQIGNEVGQNIQTNVVINNADPRSKKAIQELQNFVTKHSLNLNLLNSVIHSRADFKRAYGAGLSVTELDNKGMAAAEIKQLVNELMS